MMSEKQHTGFGLRRPRRSVVLALLTMSLSLSWAGCANQAGSEDGEQAVLMSGLLSDLSAPRVTDSAGEVRPMAIRACDSPGPRLVSRVDLHLTLGKDVTGYVFVDIMYADRSIVRARSEQKYAPDVRNQLRIYPNGLGSGWVTFRFPYPVSLCSEQKYVLFVQRTDPNDAPQYGEYDNRIMWDGYNTYYYGDYVRGGTYSQGSDLAFITYNSYSYLPGGEEVKDQSSTGPFAYGDGDIRFTFGVNVKTQGSPQPNEQSWQEFTVGTVAPPVY